MRLHLRRRSALVVVGAVAAVAFGAGFAVNDWTRSPATSAAKPSAVDIGFSQDMTVHHAQAMLMAQEALGRSHTAAIITLAREILIGQAEERGTMSGWLTNWGAPSLPSGPPMTWMAGHSTAGDSMPGMGSSTASTTMPGMATQPDLDRLDAATGKAFDVLFLQLMLRHHEGGIEMASDAETYGHLPEVRALAEVMVVQQTQEDAIMVALLTRDHAKPLPLN